MLLLLAHVGYNVRGGCSSTVMREGGGRRVRGKLVVGPFVGLVGKSRLHPRDRLPSRRRLMDRQTVISHAGLLKLHTGHLATPIGRYPQDRSEGLVLLPKTRARRVMGKKRSTTPINKVESE